MGCSIIPNPEPEALLDMEKLHPAQKPLVFIKRLRAPMDEVPVFQPTGPVRPPASGLCTRCGPHPLPMPSQGCDVECKSY